MSTPLENIPTWPPAPAHAPQEFTIGELSIFRADALTVRDPGPQRRTIKSMMFLAVFLFFGGILSLNLDLWFDYRHALHGPVVPIWNDPYFPHLLRFCTMTYAVQMLFILPLTWFSGMIRSDNGVTVFRSPRIIWIGKWSGQVLSIGTRPQLSWGKTFYIVTISIGGQTRPRGDRLEPTYRFRQLEDANRFADLLAEFLDVPWTRLA